MLFLKKNSQIILFLFGYLILLYYLVVISRYTDGVYRYKLKPFKSIEIFFCFHNLKVLFEIAINIIMLIPMGGLVYVLSKNIKITIILGFCFSVFIEISQLILQKGYFEVDDIIYNTLGSLCGAILCKYMIRIMRYVDRRIQYWKKGKK